MKIERTKNATRNIIYGVFLKIYQLLGPFILRTIFIYTLGMEYLGLNSLFTSILSVLNLACTSRLLKMIQRKFVH